MFFFSFLMLSVLTSSWMCGMGCCGLSTAQAAEVSEMVPCHEETQGKNDMNSLMFMSDCMNVDLGLSSESVLLKLSSIQMDMDVPSQINLALLQTLPSLGSKNAQAPPDIGFIQNTFPSLILTTQRFRL